MKVFFLLPFILSSVLSVAQAPEKTGYKYATAAFRKRYLVKTTADIKRILSVPPADTTESDWIEALYNIELIHYPAATTKPYIGKAFEHIEARTPEFSQALITFLYSCNLKGFSKEVRALMQETDLSKSFALCSEYLLLTEPTAVNISFIRMLSHDKKKFERDSSTASKAILTALSSHINHFNLTTPAKTNLSPFFRKDYLPGNVVVFSIQRKNRDYPGLVIVRDAEGNFYRQSDGQLFSVQQIARSITNLPYYLSDGNTPQGIYRMYGIGKSSIPFIGPTPNIQLTMPFETSIKHFLKDSTVTDTVWNIRLYQKLLPASCQSSETLCASYIAGEAGRREIIAHGTTIDPEYYRGLSFYPFTPSLGCLCTKETWDDKGMLQYSGQTLLVNALKNAGSEDGYFFVIDLDDQKKAVELKEILGFMER